MYVGECGRHLIERIKDHQRRDTTSHITKHALEKEHCTVDISNFTVIGSNFRNYRQRRVTEALHIKKL